MSLAINERREITLENVAAKAAKGSMWISAARALVNLLGFVSMIVLARVLMPADFGLVAIGTTILAIVAAVTNLSLSQALVQHSEPTDAHFHTAWTLGAARGLLIAALFSCTAGLVADFFNDPRLGPIMHWLGFSVFLSGLANPRRIMLQKDLIFWQDFVLNVTQKLVTVIVSIAFALVYRNYWALIVGTIVGQVAYVVISYTALPFRPRPTIRHFRELWSFSVWLTLGQVINTINWRFDQLLIGKLLGRIDLGYYTVGDNLAQMPTREATLPLTQALYPAFSKMQGDLGRLRHSYLRAQALVTSIALPMGVGTALIARPAILLTMGSKWLPAVIVVEALASIFALQTLGTLAQPVGMALGRTKLLFRRDMQLFLIRLPVITAGLYLGGFKGIVFARVLTGLIAIGFNLGLIRQLIGLNISAQLVANGRGLAATAIMVIAVLLMEQLIPGFSNWHPYWQISATVTVAAVAYIGSHGSLWITARRPPGPEREIVAVVGKIFDRFLTRSETRLR